MSEYNSNFLSQSFLYSFSKDGGAVGNINTGVQLPANCTLAFITVKCTASLTSSGASVISIGTATTPALILPASPFAGFVTNAVNLSSINNIMDDSLNVILAITVAPLTAGSLIGYINYFTP